MIAIIKDRILLSSNLVALLCILLSTALLIFKTPDLPAEVIFWHTQSISRQLAPILYLWAIPSWAAISLIINLSLSWRLYRKHLAISRLLAITSLFVAILAIIATLKTILIYTSIP